MIRDDASVVITTEDPTGKERAVNEAVPASELPFEVPSQEEGRAEVSINRGVTINLGNYQSARVDVSVRVPCGADGENIERAYAWASKFAADKVREEGGAITQQVS